MPANQAPQSTNSKVVDVRNLGLQDLTQLNNQLEQDLKFYKESLQNLKMAQSKFKDSEECVSKMCKSDGDKDILVPLSGSMYVPGKLADPEKVIVDIGTGYYVEKDVKAAKEYFEKKVKYITGLMGTVQTAGAEKSKIKNAIVEALESKLHAQLAQQQSSANK